MKKVAERIDYAEFLELAKQCTEEQYGEEDYTHYQEILDARVEESYEKPEKMIDPTSSSNLTHIKRDKMRDLIEAAGNLEVGKFTVKIKRLSGSAEKKKQIKDHLSISIYEKGKSNIHQKVQPYTDFRFREADWLDYFKDPMKTGENIPIETVVEIVRWLQVVEKMLVFI